MHDQQPPRGGWRAVAVIVLTAATVALAAGIAVAVGDRDSPGTVGHPIVTGTQQSAPTGEHGDQDPATSPTLTLDIARTVWDEQQQAKDASDVDAFTRTTCQRFIDDDIALRGLTDVASLLDAYQRAKRFVPVQHIDDAQVVAASGQAPGEGRVEVVAKVTDNRTVPPTPEQRTIVYAMSWEKGRWKLCPTTDPV